MKFTHNAFLTCFLEDTLSFYRDCCAMRVVKDRGAESEALGRVIWMAPEDGEEPIFVIAELLKAREQVRDPVMRHFGFDLKTREAVDGHYQKLCELGYKPSKPEYWGEVAGYLFFLHDPDGRVVEFSAEQDVSPKNWDR